MSFAGSTLSMIRSLAENRALLHLRRKRNRALYKKLVDSDSAIQDPTLTLVEQERLMADLAKYKASSKKRDTRLKILAFLLIAAIVGVVYCVIRLIML